jgi:alkylation response protein AidB-like acyl-CoA dehydrogenase
MRLNALREHEIAIDKLYWSEWHRRLGELAMAAQGRAGLVAEAGPYELNELQRLYLFSRADTIYAGTSEIQRNIIAERVLGLPK